MSIGPFCVVSDRAVIGPGCELGSGVHVLNDTIIGSGCVIRSHAVIGAVEEDEHDEEEETKTTGGPSSGVIDQQSADDKKITTTTSGEEEEEEEGNVGSSTAGSSLRLTSSESRHSGSGTIGEAVAATTATPPRRTTALGDGVKIATGVVIHAGASVGSECVVGAGSVVGGDVVVGSRTRVGHNAQLSHCDVGARCVLHHGVALGQDGFGFHHGPEGEVVKRPQRLRVVVGDDVEIGANSCVDRGSWRDTVVGAGTKVDNLVQIGHNVVIGRACILCGDVAMGGSSTLGDRVILAGKSAVSDHVKVCDDVRVGARGGVVSDISEPGDYGGFPAVPARQWRRQRARLKKMGSATTTTMTLRR